MEYLLLIVGFLLLIKGADLFVGSSSAIALKLRVPSIIIGLTIVALGTSAPELAVSITAAIDGNNGIAVGNVVGSNLFNLLFVAGFSAIMHELRVERSLMSKDYPISLVATFLLFIMCADATIFRFSDADVVSRVDGIILFVLFAGYVFITIKTALTARKNAASQGEQEELPESAKKPMWQYILFTLIGITGIVVGGDLTVDAATEIALNFGMSETLAGLTIVAVGTSLPEFVTSVVAAKKGENDIAMGNVVGSNIFNIICVLGLSAAISPITISVDNIIDSVILLVVSVIAFFAIKRNSKLRVTKTMGIIMVLTYVAYMAYAIMR